MDHVVCVKWGNKYPSQYANVLYKMVQRHTTVPFSPRAARQREWQRECCFRIRVCHIDLSITQTKEPAGDAI